jgi:tRNA1(Val) A37 N6-methylase TrmN6
MNNASLNKVESLVERYQETVKEQRISKYNEEMTKKDFILPLFEALGWKTDDSREVTAEEKISKKRVDYGFRINGIPKFFLEAKSFKENLDERKYIEQAINYAWHKGCTWAVLTNFESLKIFNAEVKTEHPWLSQFKPTLHYNDFLGRTEDLLLLSRESFEKGLLDKEAEKWGKKAKKMPIDQQLLLDFTKFRDMLSRNITKLNESKHLTEEELDESVQRILDRLIFIRNCEDRELEPKILISNYREWESKGRGQLINSLRLTFDHFDEEYNSKIFAKRLIDDLDLDNEVLHEIIEGLYRNKDNEPYDFSIIDADILGTIYEQYLGHILKKTEKRAKLTENHVHRKEQGIYYTPTNIVNYIVENTIGKLILDRKVNLEDIKVLDPACGSGSFLIKSFDLLNAQYQKREKDYSQTQLDLDTNIPFKTKSRILQSNIFGVDLDKQAVEITQLNLLLKIAEKSHRLPLLEANIKTGNSLIESETLSGDKAFEWPSEFPEVLAGGGFNAIVGNPPYYNIKSDDILRKSQDYMLLSKGVVNISALFVKKAIDLLKPNGYLGFIIPKSFAYVDSWLPLREFLFRNTQLIKVVDVSKAFKEVLLEQVIIITKKQKPQPNFKIEVISSLDSSDQITSQVSQEELETKKIINFPADNSQEIITKKMNSNSVLLGDISNNFRGIGAQQDISEKADDSIRILSGKEIQRYSVSHYHDYFITKNKLALYKKAEKLKQPKIMCQNIVAHIRDHIKVTCTYDKDGVLNLDTVNNIIISSNDFLPQYILALLNSKLISYYTYNFIYSRAIRTMHFDGSYSGKIPIKKVSIEEQQVLANLVEKITRITDKISAINFKTDENQDLRIELEKLEKELDTKTYLLYGLNNDEINTVEQSSV